MRYATIEGPELHIQEARIERSRRVYVGEKGAIAEAEDAKKIVFRADEGIAFSLEAVKQGRTWKPIAVFHEPEESGSLFWACPCCGVRVKPGERRKCDAMRPERSFLFKVLSSHPDIRLKAELSFSRKGSAPKRTEAIA